jgi:hypothetical protein
LRDEFVKRLVGVTKKHVDRSIVALVYLDDWRWVNEECPLKESFLTPYALCARTCVTLAHEWADNYRIDKSHIEFLFEKGDTDQDHLRKRMSLDYGFESIIKPTDQIISFQACDLVAWEAHRAEKIVAKEISRSKKDLRKSFIALLDIPYVHGVYHEADLRNICETVPMPTRAQIALSYTSLKRDPSWRRHRNY